MVIYFIVFTFDFNIDFCIKDYRLIERIKYKPMEVYFLLNEKMLITNEFAKWLKNTKWFAMSSIQWYLRSIYLLDDYIRIITFGERGVEYPHTIELEDIEEFAEREKLRGKDVRTVNNYLAWIKMFLKYCMYKGIHTIDYRRVMFAKEPEYKIHALDTEETKKLLNYMRNDTSKDEITRMRDYAMWLVLTYGWLRVQELIDMKVEDVREYMQVIGKGGSRRLVCLYEEHIHVIELYLFLRRKLKIKSEYVFVSHSNNSKGKQLSRTSVEDIIKKAWKHVGVKVRPHKLRHTCATQMLLNGWNIAYISQILWHKNLKTTQTYLDYANSELKKTQRLIPLM